MVGRAQPQPSIVQGPTRGEVHIVDFPDLDGRVVRGPCVVVQTDRMRRSSTVVVVPLTSFAKAAPLQPAFLAEVGSSESGLSRDGWAKCDQPMTVPASLLGAPTGRLSPEAIARLDAALRFVLGF